MARHLIVHINSTPGPHPSPGLPHTTPNAPLPFLTLSLRQTYLSSSQTLATTAFFGASLSYSLLLSLLHPVRHLHLIAWAAACFLLGAVGAGAMSVLGSEAGDLIGVGGGGQGRVWKSAVRGYGYASCGLVMVGLVCLNMTLVLSSGKEGSTEVGTVYDREAVMAAGIFGIAGSVVLVVGALGIRLKYGMGDEEQRFYHIESSHQKVV